MAEYDSRDNPVNISDDDMMVAKIAKPPGKSANWEKWRKSKNNFKTKTPSLDFKAIGKAALEARANFYKNK